MPPIRRYTPDEANLLIGKGEVFIDRFDTNGLSTGFRSLGNSHATTIQNVDEIIKSYSGMDHEAGLYAQSVKRREPVVNLNFEEWVPENTALQTMGDVALLEQDAASEITDEEITTNAIWNRWYRLQNRNVTGVSVTAGGGSSSASAMTEDTDTVEGDYSVDEVSGRIYIIPDRGIAEGDSVFVTYTPGEVSLEVVNMGTHGRILAALHFIPDPTEGPKIEYEAWKVSIVPDGEVGLITEEYAQGSIKATVLKDRVFHPNQPYGRLIYL